MLSLRILFGENLCTNVIQVFVVFIVIVMLFMCMVYAFEMFIYSNKRGSSNGFINNNIKWAAEIQGKDSKYDIREKVKLPFSISLGPAHESLTKAVQT